MVTRDNDTDKKNIFPLGAMYWINPNYTLQQIDEDMKRIKQNNFSFIRSIIWWENIEEKEGHFDFAMYDMLYKAAAKNGIKIAQCFGMYPPTWLIKRLADKGITSTARYFCMDIPDFYTKFELYIKAVVKRYANHPAQDMWVVWNELSQPPCPCKYTKKKFRQWLRDKYGTIDKLKKAWRKEKMIFTTPCPDSFEDIDTSKLTLEKMLEGIERRNYPLVFDWLTFCTWNLTQNLKWICNKVKEIDTIHPTHTNAGLSDNEVPSSHNPWQTAKVVDSTGASIHPCHMFRLAKDIRDFPAAFSYSTDLILSSAKTKDVWISELQGGANIRSGVMNFSPTKEEIKSWLWQSIAKGIKGILFWIWQAWRAGWEAGEFSLLNGVNGAPSERSKAAAEVGRILNENSDFLSTTKRTPAEVAILYSTPTQILAYREAIPDYPVLAMFGCYKALWKNNIAVDFVTPEEIKNGILSNYKLLYMPFAEVINKELGKDIKEFVFKGGNLWADGHCAFRDDYSFLHSQNPGAGLDEVFGCREANLMAGRGTINILSKKGDAAIGYLFEQWLEPIRGKVIASFENGEPAVIVNSYGKGKSMFIGTYLSIGYAQNEDKGAEHLIIDFAKETGVKPIVELDDESHSLETNLLIGEEADLVVATNHSGKQISFTMGINGNYVQIKDLLNKKDIDFDITSNGITKIKSILPEYETIIYLARKEK